MQTRYQSKYAATDHHHCKEFIRWDPEFSVNVKIIDDQHQQLVEILNELCDAVLSGQSSPVLLRTLNRMDRYIRKHFAEEEKLMESCGYPALESHKYEHEIFIKKLTFFHEQLRGNRLLLSMDVLMFLRDWLTHHILKTDKAYSNYLNAHDVC